MCPFLDDVEIDHENSFAMLLNQPQQPSFQNCG